MNHNFFKPKSFEEAKHAVTGDCNNIDMKTRFNIETPLFAKEILKYVPENGIVLDYGVGCGRLVREILLQRPDVKIIGLDTSSEMLQLAKEYVNDSVRFTTTLPYDLKLLNVKFDVAYAIYVFQHCPSVDLYSCIQRIHYFLKPEGKFIHCSSDFRMSITFNNQGFFDDRFLGVDIREEISKLFDEKKELFDNETLEANPILKTMIKGGLPHPAFIYQRKNIIEPYFDIPLEGIKVYKDGDRLVAGREIEKKLSQPQKLLLINRLSPGDILVMANAIRDLHLAYPGKFITDVRTPCPDIFTNNPYITKLTYDEAQYNEINTWFAFNVGKTKMLGDIMCVDMQYPLIHQSGARGAHFAEGHREFLEETLKIKIPQTKIRPELYLSEQEKMLPRLIKEKYWVINAGSKGDYTLKQYPYYQEVVNLLKDKITFVQIGVSLHNHKPLDNVIDMVGKTNNRELFRLIYYAEGVISCVAFPMHIAAAFKKPCVVVAGAREGTRWELYPNHRFIYVNGCLPCADYDGCWRSKTEECNYKKNGIPLCMSLIKPEEVAREVGRYYEGGVLKYDIKEPVILNLKGEDKMRDFKEKTITEEMLEKTKYKTHQNAINLTFKELHTLQVDSAIFNTLRILKQLTPNDTYLEAYQWHYDKRKDKFMDIYHFLWYLGSTIRPKRILEIGTRTGISICQLLSAYLNYNELEKVILCDLFNDGLSTPEVVLNALKYLNIPVDKVQFIMGNSLEEIPKLIGKESFSYILIDGSHDRNDARQDLENSYKLIEQDGYLCFDDIGIDGCNLQPVWDEFKTLHNNEFIFSEDNNGKGLGVGRKYVS